MSSSSQIAFIAGATGYTGSHLVPVLVERGWTVHAHVRPDSSKLGEWTRRFEEAGAHVDTTPWDPGSMRATFRRIQPTVVFSLLGTTKKRAKIGDSGQIEDTYEAVDYGLTALLLRATIDESPRARFVYLSAWGVKPNTNNAYMNVRARIEKELRQSALDYLIIRPAVIGGDREESRPLERVGGVLGTGVSKILGAVGAKRAAGDVRTRTGHELATNCADAAAYAKSRRELTGADLDALSRATS